MSKVSLRLWYQKICEICNVRLICSMVVVTLNSYWGIPGSIPWRNQINSPLLPRNWHVKTIGEGDHKVVCRWRQLTLAERGELRQTAHV